MKKLEKKFWEWRDTKYGTIVWIVVRPLLALTLLSIHIFVPSTMPIRWVFWWGWLVLVFPDWIPILASLWWYIGKIIGFGRFKAGTLLKVASERGKPVYSIMYSPQCKSIEQCNHEFYSIIFGDFEPAKLAEEKVRNPKRVAEPNLVFLVLEDEEINKNPFWIKWDPFSLKQPSRVKVLVDNGIYWANPRHFVRLREDDEIGKQTN